MKAIYSTALTAGALTAALTGCTGMRLSNSNALADDIYFDGSAAPKTVVAVDQHSAISSADVASYDKRVAGYTSSRSNNTDNRDFSQIQQYYSNASATNGATPDTLSANKSIVVEAEQTEGYWLDGFDGTDADQSYAERIIRFHRPITTISYYSPLYTYARYSGDWNVYVDHYGSAYMVPTWTNPWYDDFYYGWGWGYAGWHAHLGWGGWGYSWGWHHPWGWHHGWDYAWGGWGWHSPYYYQHYYYHPYGGPHNEWHPRTYASRFSTQPQSYSSRSRGSNTNTTVTTNPNSSRAAQRYAQSSGARSYTRNIDGSSTRSSAATTNNATTGNSRRSTASTTPTAQPSTRSSNATTQTGNSRRSSSSTTQVNSGSSRSSSSYTPSVGNSRSSSRSTVGNSRTSSSSSRSSSYSPSRSSSSYSSSSSSRSSGSSSRSYSSGGSSRGSSGGGFSGGSGGSRGGSSSSSHSSSGGGGRGGR